MFAGIRWLPTYDAYGIYFNERCAMSNGQVWRNKAILAGEYAWSTDSGGIECW
jgi:hypothetical protein